MSDLQIQAGSLSQLASDGKTVSPQDLTSAVTALVSFFNTSTATVRTAAALPGDPVPAQDAKGIDQALMSTVANEPGSTNALAAIGITVQAGALSLNVKQLAQALDSNPDTTRATLGQWGQRIDRSASQELDATGHVSDAFSKLQHQARKLDAQQSALASAGQATAAYRSTASQRQVGLATYQSSIG
ncbi:hypothetical protein GALL_503340 [mine drainage metagenome]|uniref:Flagellar hook-associated protein 2 C-terminal domain-containing protein n=1 Tax=mine drainage metagenome TaxID=410659 RepID=A0A1J5P901_9ZZZZ